MEPAAHPLRLALELERGAEPIAGCLSDEAGRRREFLGWLELTRALEEAWEESAGLASTPEHEHREGER
jgi:hypothetical protein